MYINILPNNKQIVVNRLELQNVHFKGWKDILLCELWITEYIFFRNKK